MGKGMETCHQNRMGLIRMGFLEEPHFESGFTGGVSSWGRKQVTEEDHVPKYSQDLSSQAFSCPA